MGCSKLASIALPEGVCKIAYDAFRDCAALSSITLPSTLETIGSFAFYGCNINTVNVPSPDFLKSVVMVDKYSDPTWVKN
jgi:hypothetical protein